MGIALQCYESFCKCYPGSYIGGTRGNWSAQVAILPFMERYNIYRHVDFSVGCTQVVLPDGTLLSAQRVPTYLCPSEPKDEVRYKGGVATHYPLSYGYNTGVWLVYDPKTGRGGLGAFYPYSWLRPADFRDGLSSTLAFSEIKAYEPYFRNLADPGPLGIPIAPSDVCNLGFAQFMASSGHTEWSEGRCHQTGFTSAFGPNTRLLCTVGGIEYDVNWTNQQEGLSATIPTYAAVMSRSHHPGVVSSLLMDGSVRSFSETIDLATWRPGKRCRPETGVKSSAWVSEPRIGMSQSSGKRPPNDSPVPPLWGASAEAALTLALSRGRGNLWLEVWRVGGSLACRCQPGVSLAVPPVVGKLAWPVADNVACVKSARGWQFEGTVLLPLVDR